MNILAYCPKYPDALRGGDFALIKTNLQLPMLNASRHCVSNENGKLPDVIDSGLFESFMSMHPSSTFWTSLEKPWRSTCSGQSCENSPEFIWADGSMLSNVESFPIELKNTGNCGKVVISASASDHFKIESENCNTLLDVVCMVPCRNSGNIFFPQKFFCVSIRIVILLLFHFNCLIVITSQCNGN